MERHERLEQARQGIRAVERYVYFELSDDETNPARAAQVQTLLRLTVGLRRKLQTEE